MASREKYSPFPKLHGEILIPTNGIHAVGDTPKVRIGGRDYSETTLVRRLSKNQFR